MDGQTTPTTLKQRLWGFLGAHLLFNVLALVPLGICMLYLGLLHEGDPMRPLLSLPGLFSLGVYFPLGMWLAKAQKWTVPTRKDNLLTTVLPAAVFALFVLLVVVFPLNTDIGSVSFLVVAILNIPQTVFLLSAALLFAFPFRSLFLFAAALFLPSLFFTLGSRWQSRRQTLT